MSTQNHFSAIVRSYLRIAVGLVLAVSGQALGERLERAVTTWRPTKYDVEIRFDDQLTEVSSARAVISILVLRGPLDALELDFGAMQVGSVNIDGVAAAFEHRGELLSIKLVKRAEPGAAFAVEVQYRGRPNDGLILARDKAGRPSAIGDNWPRRVHHWIPCLDHPSAKAQVRFVITAPERNIVVANGRCTGTASNADSTRTWTYVEERPIPPYCMVIAVAQFAQLSPSAPVRTPLAYYVSQIDRDKAVQGFGAAPVAISWFSQKVAPYPYEKLALIVGPTRFGGMENAGAIVFSNHLFDGDNLSPRSQRFNIGRGVVQLTAHEIAHQWWGDSVTPATWADLWLSEGFATYFAGLFLEEFEGRGPFREFMQEAADKYFQYERTQKSPVYDRETEDLFKLLNANNYQKGAWILHMLRGMLGDEAFFNGIRDFYASHEGKIATSEDFQAAMERASRSDLREFFGRWVYGLGHPIYDVTWSWQAPQKSRGAAVIRVHQRQASDVFCTPLPIEIVTRRGVNRTVLRPTERESVFQYELEDEPTALRVDPDDIILNDLPRTNRR